MLFFYDFIKVSAHLKLHRETWPVLRAQFYENINFSIYDLVGKQVFQEQLQKGHNEIDLENLDSGIYIYRLNDGQMLIRAGKLMKQKNGY